MACGIPVAAMQSSPVFSGVWGGDRANMLIGPKATTIDFDCGAILIVTPLKINAQGIFSARGSFDDMSSGPVDPDLPVNRRPVSVRGQFGGDILTLTIRVSGEPAPRRLHLEKDRRVKLIRCM